MYKYKYLENGTMEVSLLVYKDKYRDCRTMKICLLVCKYKYREHGTMKVSLVVYTVQVLVLAKWYHDSQSASVQSRV